jgi:hypothetical protein
MRTILPYPIGTLGTSYGGCPAPIATESSMPAAARLLSAATLAGLLMSGAPAVATPAAPGPAINARASDDVVAPGESVVVRGRFTRGGAPAVGHTVKVQSGYVGHWADLPCARVRTGDDGRYRVRVVLYRHGVRDLRVVGIVAGPRRNAYDRLTLMVTRGG